jgi:uncharacterized protein (DUF2225 family)
MTKLNNTKSSGEESYSYTVIIDVMDYSEEYIAAISSFQKESDLACRLFLFVSCLVYSLKLQMEATCTSRTSGRLRTTRKTVSLVISTVEILNGIF